MKRPKKTLYLIDGNSLCYRAYYAIKDLTTSKGLPTNAIYGFVNMLKKVIKDHGPDMMAVVFDMAGPTDRHEKYEEYKLHREPMPESLAEQMEGIKKVVEAFNIPVVQKRGYEADDIIATIADEAAGKDIKVTIVTGDKDALQLIGDNIEVLSPHPMGDKLYGEKEVLEKYGVPPESMVEMMALMGDQSDNVPGVKGVGRVTAAKLVKEFGTVEGLYRDVQKVGSGSLRKKLAEGESMARLSRELVELNRNVPVDFDIKSMRREEENREKLLELFSEFEFTRFVKELAPEGGDDRESPEYPVIRTASEMEKVLAGARSSGRLAIVAGVGDAGVNGLGLAWGEHRACYVNLSDSGLKTGVKSIIEDPSILKIGYDLKSDIGDLEDAGIVIAGDIFDVLIALYLNEPSRPGYDLSEAAYRMLNYRMAHDGAWDKKGQAVMAFSGSGDANAFSEKADVLFRLYGHLEDVLEEKKLSALFRDVEMPLVRVLRDMEREGIGIDPDILEKQSMALEEKLAALSSDIYGLAGEEFNINSPKQLQVVLYDKLGLPVIKKTKTGRSTDESVLAKLSTMHQLPCKLLEYRELSKLKSGYYDSIRELVDERTGKLHPRFNQAVTATGRLSSSEPNIQNIPVKTPLGRKIRKAFNPGEKGHVMLGADYSQVELRILAHLSGDKKLVKAFAEGEDVHSYTASLIFDTAINKVTPRMRGAAKTVNFGIIYGISAYGLSKDLKIRVDEARNFIDAYFERYSGVKHFIESTVGEARENGFVRTILDRRRYIPEINSPNEHVKSFAERAAVNTPVQGSAADLIKLAMLKCHEAFRDTRVKMIIQVHDELVFKVPGDELSARAEEVRRMMEGVMSLRVPLKVDIESGPNWYDMEKLKQ